MLNRLFIRESSHLECVALLEKSREHAEALKQKASRRLLKESMAGGLFVALMTRTVVSTFTTGSYMIEV